MANDYYTRAVLLAAGTRARGSDVVGAFENVEAGFDKLPAPRTDGNKGFNEVITVEAATGDNHAPRKSQIYNWTANIVAGGYKITGLGTPTADTDAATKAYVDTWTGARDAGGNKLTNLADGTAAQDAVTFNQANTILAAGASPADVAITSLNVGTATDGERIRVSGTAVVGQQISAAAADGSMYNGDVLTVTHDAVATADRFERIVQVMKETVGVATSAVDTAVDWDSANSSLFSVDNATFGTTFVSPTSTALAVVVPTAASYVDTSLWESLDFLSINERFINGFSSDDSNFGTINADIASVKVDATTVVSAYTDSAGDLNVLAGALSGDTITNGSSVEMQTTAGAGPGVAHFDGIYYAATYYASSQEYYTLFEIAAGTTNITKRSAANTGVDWDNNFKGNLHSIGDGRVFRTGKNVNTGNYLFARIITRSGTTPVIGAVTEDTGVSPAGNVRSCLLSATKAVVAYDKTGYDLDLQSITIGVSPGNTLTFDANDHTVVSGATFNPADIWIEKFNDTYFALSFRDVDAGTDVVKLFSLSGGTFTEEDSITLPATEFTTDQFNPARLYYYSDTEMYLSSGRMAAIFRIVRSGTSISLDGNHCAVGKLSSSGSPTYALYASDGDFSYVPLSSTQGVYHEILNPSSGLDETRGVVIKRDADGQLYTPMVWAVSVDDYDTWSVLRNGAKRDIASSLASVHGGTDGVWYYINNSDVWTAATSDTSLAALKDAFGHTDNYMCNHFLTAAQITTLGWAKSANSKLRIGVGMYTQDDDAYFDAKAWYTTRSAWAPLYANHTVNLELEDKVLVTYTDTGPDSIRAAVMLP